MTEVGGITLKSTAIEDEEEQEIHWTERPPTILEQVALRFFGTAARKRMSEHPQLGMKLSRAGLGIVPVAYLASVYLRTFMVLALGLPSIFLYLALAGGSAQFGFIVPLVAAPMLLSIVVYSSAMYKPDMMIRQRRRDLDDNLPYALNFMATMAGAGVIAIEVWGSLGRQEVYGEVAAEARKIYRDSKVLSKDLVSAMRAAARRSPSQHFEEFLTGSVNAVTSGGDLRNYFLSKAEHYTEENRRKQRAFLESLGVMSESYVVVGAAAPLFMIVIISIMVLVRSGATDPTQLLNLIVLLVMPVIHLMFGSIIGNMRPT